MLLSGSASVPLASACHYGRQEPGEWTLEMSLCLRSSTTSLLACHSCLLNGRDRQGCLSLLPWVDFSQKESFKPNWISRGSPALLIFPMLGLPT
jgi:hypothetical protein